MLGCWKENISIKKSFQFIDSALKLFVEFGFHNTPTSKIAKETGAANGTLFYFFPTKDDLVKALYLEIKNRTGQFLAESISKEKGIQNILKSFFISSLKWAADHGTSFLFIEQFNNSPYAKKLVEEEIKNNMKPILDLLQQGMEENLIKPMDLELMYTLTTGHAFGINTYLMGKNYPTQKQDEIMEESFALLWKMISI